MIFKRFVIALALRVVLAGLAMTAFVWLLLLPGYHSSMALVGVVLVLLTGDLWRYVSRTNREVARFLEAARYADYSQRFNFDRDGSIIKFTWIWCTLIECHDNVSANTSLNIHRKFW